MNEAQQIELMQNIRVFRDSLTALLNQLQDNLQDVAAPVTDDDPKLQRLAHLAKKKLAREEGRWVIWHDLRPAYRDRDRYSDPVWEALSADPEVQTRTSLAKGGLRREARYEPLI